MEVERPAPVDISDMNFVDDEDLQASLSKARRLATKKAIKTLTPEQIAKNRKSYCSWANSLVVWHPRPSLTKRSSLPNPTSC